MQQSMLKLNANKTELLCISTNQRLSKWQLPSIKFDTSVVAPSGNVRNLGIRLDKNMNMDAFVNATCKSASFHLYNVWMIRQYLSTEAA